jgi:hypothetical protein
MKEKIYAPVAFWRLVISSVCGAENDKSTSRGGRAAMRVCVRFAGRTAHVNFGRWAEGVNKAPALIYRRSILSKLQLMNNICACIAIPLK